MKMNFSKKALWLACNSDFSKRLTEITLEHTSLAKELILNGHYMNVSDRENIMIHIETLRHERDGIISLFEDNRSDA